MKMGWLVVWKLKLGPMGEWIWYIPFIFVMIIKNFMIKENVKKQLQELVDNFSVDDEIDMYRQDANYKSNFTISQSLEDFTEYQKKLEDLANNFNTKYHELNLSKIYE